MSVIAQISPLASIIRPLIGLSLVATFIMLFKPLLSGVLRAALLMLKPRIDTAPARPSRLKSFMLLNRMAREVEMSEPGLANELRNLAGRD